MLKAKLFAVGLGLLTVFSQTGFAADLVAARPYCPCPPAYGKVCPPGHTGGVITPAPQEVHPGDLPGDTDPDKPATDPNAPPTDAGAVPPAAGNGNFGAPPALSGGGTGPSGIGSGVSGGGAGARAGIIGRLDAGNRLNIFDNQSAIPQSRVWVAYQFAEGQDVSVLGTGAPNGARNNLNVYRMGLELAITEDFSVSAQTQYIDPNDDITGALDEGFTDPQLLAKYVVYEDMSCEDDLTLISATLGYQIEDSNSPGLVDNSDSRVYPGMLFYKEQGDYFHQGGIQFGLSTQEDPTTFDWSYSLGYWAYRNDCCCDAGCDGWISSSYVLGVAPQVGILGKHVMGDNDINNPFGIPGVGVTLDENRHVLDATLGATVLLKGGVGVNMGYSFPITGAEERRGEFITQLNWYF